MAVETAMSFSVCRNYTEYILCEGPCVTGPYLPGWHALNSVLQSLGVCLPCPIKHALSWGHGGVPDFLIFVLVFVNHVICCFDVC